ncbi:MAG TPA: hypothetical protein VKF61_05005 [Candidatus Polarisedimenticolia bacterium]|nr:hypothetical protein [Candidatus Polarisedimenticolia bacterium]
MAHGPSPDRSSRFSLQYVAPVMLLLVWSVWPVLRGAETFYLRDVFNTHLELKWAGIEAMRHGRLPLIDPYRAGGQPLLGNPNALTLYPDALLFFVASPLRALSAHFWIHFLLAPFSFFWLARALGLGRASSWAAGVCYALSGYYLSTFVFYNLIVSATLAPAFAAASLGLATGPRPGRMAWAAGSLWALLILSGDPLGCLVALGLAVALVALRSPKPRGLGRVAAIVVCGTLLAAPQIVESLRILGTSYRGAHGYSASAVTAESWDPRQTAEWLLPFVFGRPDLLDSGGFWGHRFYTDRPPYLFSLYPGLLAIALVGAASFARGRVVRFAQVTLVLGLFLALGRFNPLAGWLFEWSGGLLRYPVRLFILVAIASSVLAGIGFEKVFREKDARAARAFWLVLALLAILFALGWMTFAFSVGPADSLVRNVVPPSFGAPEIAGVRERWARLCAGSLVALAALASGAYVARRRPEEGCACLIAAHAAAQIVFLSPLLASDLLAPYRAASPVLDFVPETSLVVHGASEGLFAKPGPDRAVFPDPRALWFERRAFHELYPFAGALAGRTYELNVSSEGMDSFLSTAARDAARISTDAERIRLLAAWGVDRLLLDRALDPAAVGDARLLANIPSYGGSLQVYEIPGAAPRAYLAKHVLRAPDPLAALALMKEASFDPRSSAVIPADGPPVDGSEGEVRLIEEEAERISAEVSTSSPGLLVIQRAFQPIYRASIDGTPARIRIANLHRVGVDVPAGRHRVELRADRRPLWLSFGGSVFGMAGLVLLGRRRRPSAGPVGIVASAVGRP